MNKRKNIKIYLEHAQDTVDFCQDEIIMFKLQK